MLDQDYQQLILITINKVILGCRDIQLTHLILKENNIPSFMLEVLPISLEDSLALAPGNQKETKSKL